MGRSLRMCLRAAPANMRGASAGAPTRRPKTLAINGKGTVRSLDQTFKSVSIGQLFRALPFAAPDRHGSRRTMRPSYAIWRDRRGRLTWLRIVTLGAFFVPVALAISAAFMEDGYGAR